MNSDSKVSDILSGMQINFVNQLSAQKTNRKEVLHCVCKITFILKMISDCDEFWHLSTAVDEDVDEDQPPEKRKIYFFSIDLKLPGRCRSTLAESDE